MLFFRLLLGTHCICASLLYADIGTSTRIINNTKLPIRVTNYEVPIYSRADTKIQPIKSQEELQDLLYEAIETNSKQEIMEIVKAGADVNLFIKGKAPLMWATILKKLNSVEVLKKCGAIIPCPQNMLHRAILNNSAEDIRHAIDAGADPNEKSSKAPLGLAIFLAKSNAVQTLLESGAHLDSLTIPKNSFIDYSNNSLKPIEYALLMKDLTTARLVLKYSKNIKIHQMFGNQKDIFEYLLDSVDPIGIKGELLELMQELIDKGYNINSSSYNGDKSYNAFQYKSAWVSIICGQFYFVEALELLMKNGANPNQIIRDGLCIWAPLHIAIQANNISAVKFLIDAGADLTKRAGPSVPNGRSTVNPPQTPLSYAKALAYTGVENNEIINLLLSHKAPLA